jgi:hypothetical protein
MEEIVEAVRLQLLRISKEPLTDPSYQEGYRNALRWVQWLMESPINPTRAIRAILGVTEHEYPSQGHS